MSTHVGNLLINDALPEDLRKAEGYKLDKAGTHALLREVAEKHPDKYKDVLKALNDIGRSSAFSTGTSVSLSALRKSQAKQSIIGEARAKVDQLIDNEAIPQEEKDKAIKEMLLPLGPKLHEALYEEAKKEGNPYFLQIESGSRGKKSDYNSLRGADLLVADHTGTIMPMPIFNSYADGLDPAEYWASGYGQRAGQVKVKFATGDAGFAAKQLVNAAHRLVVDKEQPHPTRLPVGLPVPTADKDNVGGVLAAPAKLGNQVIPAGTTLTAKHLADLKDAGTDEIVLHSPLTEPSENGGISRLAAGRRDRFDLSRIGDNIGVPAAQSIGEKLSQGTLSAKHSGGVAKSKKDREGFELFNRMLQAPEYFPETGPLAHVSGQVVSVEKAPQGGHHITVIGKPSGDGSVSEHRHYANEGIEPTVKVGDRVEAGDSLTDGLPHPVHLLQHHGIGEARRVYMGHLGEILANTGAPTHRRNLEAVVAGLLNWTKVTDPDGIGDHVPDDVVDYNQLTHNYKPRPDAQLQKVGDSHGRYLEEPALHYSIGTRVTPKVALHLSKHGIKDIHTHHRPPGFEPHMARGVMGVHADPDWQTQLAGFYTTSAFERSAQRGAESNPNSTSFVGALAKGTDFGKNLSTTGRYGA